MTSALGRLYVSVIALVVFFLVWAVIAARPWVSASESKADPRLVALKAREQRLHRDAITIKKIVDRRWATYRAELAQRKHLIAVRARQNAARAQAQAQAVQQIHAYRQPSYQAPAAAPPAAAPPVVKVTPAPPATSTRTS